MDVRKDTSRSNGNSSKQLVQLLIVLHGKGDVTGHDTSLLVVTSGVTSKLEDLGTEVLEDSGEVDGGTLWYWNRKYIRIVRHHQCVGD